MISVPSEENSIKVLKVEGDGSQNSINSLDLSALPKEGFGNLNLEESIKSIINSGSFINILEVILPEGSNDIIGNLSKNYSSYVIWTEKQ